MRKIWIVFAAVVMVLAIGTAVYAVSDEEMGFQQMLPFMKQMHPDVSDQQLQEMYNDCHDDEEYMPGVMNNDSMSNMMGNGSMQNMMNNSAATLQ